MRVALLALLVLIVSPAFSQQSSPEESEDKTKATKQYNTPAYPIQYAPTPYLFLPQTLAPVIDAGTYKNAGEKSQCAEHKNWKEWGAFAWCRSLEWITTERVIAIFTIILGSATVFLYWATRGLVKSSERTAERQLRAYLGFASAHVLDMQRLMNKQDFEIHIVIKNNGQTPAYDVESTSGTCIEKSDIEDLPEPTGTPHKTTVGPNVFSHKFIHKTALTDEEIAGLHDRTLCLYGYCHYVYRDAFYKTRRSKIRVQIGGTSGWRPDGLMANAKYGNYED